MRRCIGLLPETGTALHKLMKDEKAQESVDLGEDLIGVLAKAQIQFEGKELSQDILHFFYKKIFRQCLDLISCIGIVSKKTLLSVTH